MRFFRGPEKLPVHTSCRIFVVAERPFRISPPQIKKADMFLSIPERNMSAGFRPRCGPRGGQPAGWTKQPDYPPETPLRRESVIRCRSYGIPAFRIAQGFSLHSFTPGSAAPYRTPSFRAVSCLPAPLEKQRRMSSWHDGIAVRRQTKTFRLTASLQRASVPHNSTHRRVFVMQRTQKRGQLGSYVYSYMYAPRRCDAGEVRTCSRGA
jgi:hypothetical protein